MQIMSYKWVPTGCKPLIDTVPVSRILPYFGPWHEAEPAENLRLDEYLTTYRQCLYDKSHVVKCVLTI